MDKKLCRVRVLGRLEQDGEKEEIETVSDGFASFEEGTSIIRYKEISEEAEEETKVAVIFSESRAAGGAQCRIVKTGAVESDMLFIPGYQTMCIYRMPFGNLEIEIETYAVELEITAKEAKGHLKYALSSNGSVVSEAEVFIDAVFRD